MFCYGLSFAQDKHAVTPLSGEAYIDSLIKRVPDYRDDTNKVKLLNSISLGYNEYNPEAGIRFGKTALALAQRLPWQKGIPMVYNSIGANNQNLGNNAIAMDYYTRARNLYEALGDERGVARMTGNIAGIYHVESNYVKALEYWFEALGVFEKLNDSVGIANQLCNIGMLYQEQGNYAKALEYSGRSMEKYRELGDRESEAMQLGNLANTYDKMGDAKKALDAYNRTLAIYEAAGNKEGIARSLTNMSTTYSAAKDQEMALDCQLRALELYKEIGFKDGVGVAYSNLASFYLVVASDTGKITAGKHIPADKRKSLELALQYAQEAITILAEMNDLNMLLAAYKILAEAQMEAGNCKQARISYAQYALYRDSVFSIENKKTIADLDLKRELQLKDKQIELDKLAVVKKRNERVFFIAGIVFLLAAAAIVIRNMKLKAAKELSDNKLNAFQARMNPHFIFNSLSSIQSLMMNNENEASIDYLSEFSTLMRQILDNSAKNKVLLKTEIAMLRSYIQLEHLRFDCFTWNIHVGENVNEEMVEVPGMIIQPFVENAILHGLIPRGEGGDLSISFDSNKKQIICTVEDNGIGREKSAELNSRRRRSHQSHGVNIATNRLTLLNDSKRGIVNNVTYIDKVANGQPTGTKVIIQIPIL